MGWWVRLLAAWRRLVAIVRRRRLERDIDDELAFHVAMRAEASARDGQADAARAARLQFGSLAAYREQTREMWTFSSFESVRQDLRYTARVLRRAPAFTIVAVLALAIGIGANTAIFSLVEGIVVRGLPYPDADRLVVLIGNVERASVERRGDSYPDFVDWREQSRSFDGIAAFTTDTTTLAAGGEPERLDVEDVSAPYFSLLAVSAARGRVFRADEDAVPDRDAVCVIGDGLWKRRFGADPGVVGRTITLGARLYTVVGVLPPGFAGLSDTAELWRPFMMSGWDLEGRGSRGFYALARLKAGTTPAAAQAELAGISRRLAHAYPDTNDKRSVEVSPLSVETFGRLTRAVVTLMTAVLLVLLIACANVATLLIGRSETRQREIALRAALGAGRRRLLRQLVTESLVLTAIGAGAGVVLARLAIPVLVASSPIALPSFFTPRIDLPVFAFTVASAVACGLLLGLAPALHTRVGAAADALKNGNRGSSGGVRSRRSRTVLVVAEVALAVVLAAGAGLMIQTVRNLAALDPGFDTGNVLTMSVAIPRQPTPAASPGVPPPPPPFVASSRILLDHVRAVPGVTSASLATDLPLGGDSSAVFYHAEGDTTTDATTVPRAYVHRVTPGFFATLDMPLRRGRTFLDRELTADSTAVIVSQGVMRRFWPDGDPIGKRLRIGSRPWFTVVGVVDDVRYRGLPANPTADPDLYFPFVDRGVQSLAVRSALPPTAVAASVRAAIRAVDPSIVIYGQTTLAERAARQTAAPRFTMWLMGLFAAAAMLLAVIGVYGVMAYLVAHRRREFGIRLALGATRRRILRLVVGEGALLVAGGVAAGGVAACFLARALDTLAFSVGSAAPAAVGAVALLAVVALLACAIPAARATRVNPATALRE
jgi:putative ABC transport system permease protein